MRDFFKFYIRCNKTSCEWYIGLFWLILWAVAVLWLTFG
jgi:hypothetical protein